MGKVASYVFRRHRKTAARFLASIFLVPLVISSLPTAASASPVPQVCGTLWQQANKNVCLDLYGHEPIPMIVSTMPTYTGRVIQNNDCRKAVPYADAGIEAKVSVSPDMLTCSLHVSVPQGAYFLIRATNNASLKIVTLTSTDLNITFYGSNGVPSVYIYVMAPLNKSANKPLGSNYVGNLSLPPGSKE